MMPDDRAQKYTNLHQFWHRLSDEQKEKLKEEELNLKDMMTIEDEDNEETLVVGVLGAKAKEEVSDTHKCFYCSISSRNPNLLNEFILLLSYRGSFLYIMICPQQESASVNIKDGNRFYSREDSNCVYFSDEHGHSDDQFDMHRQKSHNETYFNVWPKNPISQHAGC